MALKTILLLTREEEYPFLSSWLQNASEANRPLVFWTPTLAVLETIPDAVLVDARLIAFCTSVIVPRRILERLGYGAYNFHPGSPDYPGWAAATFALYDNATTFGATVHEMHEKVDSGPIVGVELFPVPAEANLSRLEELAYTALLRLFKSLAPALAARPEPARTLDVPWTGRLSSRRKYAELCDIPRDIGAADLQRRLRALGTTDGMSRPTVTLHGHRFQLIQEPAAGKNAGG